MPLYRLTCTRLSDVTRVTPLFTYSDADTYSEDIPVNIVWIKPDGLRTPLVGQSVNFKRNVLTTLEFDVKDINSTSGINITADEELVTGDTVIADQDGTNTEVNPGQ